MPGYGLEPQIVMTTPLLEGLDGVDKMSKSLGNYVGVTETPDEMFGKLMSITDDLMWRYYLLLTDLYDDEIATLQSRVEPATFTRRRSKIDLARRVVRDFHGAAAAAAAAAEFDRVHTRR